MHLHRLATPVAMLVACVGFAARAAEIDPATIMSLTPAEATALVEQGEDPLELPKLQSLSAEAARASGEACGRLRVDLELPALASLPADVAAGLAPDAWFDLSLPAVTELTVPAAAGLARCGDDELELQGLDRISPAAAEALVAHRGGLVLAGVTELTGRDAQAVARALARKPGRVKLSWLEVVAPRTLEILAASGRVETPDLEDLELVPDHGSGSLDDVVLPERTW